MVQEKFWYPKEIDLKYTFFNLLLIFNLCATASPSEELNSFFNNELTFIHTSFNKFDKTYDRSEGSFVRNDDNSVRIDINYPFREIYFLNDDGIETHDLEFNQVKFIPIEQTNNNFFVNFILKGYFDESNIIENDFKTFTIIDNNKKFYFEFIDQTTLQIKYKDNMDIDNLIKFLRTDGN